MRLLYLFFYLTSVLIGLINPLSGQADKTMTPNTYMVWNKIGSQMISDNGHTIVYTSTNETSDPTLYIYDNLNKSTVVFPRAKSIVLQPNGAHVIHLRTHHTDSIKMLKRKKVKKKDFPKDSLVIYNVANKASYVIPDVSSFQSPTHYSGTIVYKPELKDNPEDSTATKSNRDIIIIKDLITNKEDTIANVKNFYLSDYDMTVIYDTNQKGEHEKGIFEYDIKSGSTKPVVSHPALINKCVFGELNNGIILITNPDTTEANHPAYDLWHSINQQKYTRLDQKSIENLPSGWQISDNKMPFFTDNGDRIFFGISPLPKEQDTTLLEEEIVQVEVWNYMDQRLYTQQENDLESDRKKSYLSILDLNNGTAKALEVDQMSIEASKYSTSEYAIGQDRSKYEKYLSWKGYTYGDIYLINLNNGQKTFIQEKQAGYPNLSPNGKYVTWFEREEGVYKIYNIKSKTTNILTNNSSIGILNEDNDVPQFPNSYGIAGWTVDDKSILIYDKYDIWEIAPNLLDRPKRITQGRETDIVYRIIDLDNEQRWLNRSNPILLRKFDKNTFYEGYAYLYNNNIVDEVDFGPYNVRSRPIKAKNANIILTSKENFSAFPDILVTDSTFNKYDKISDINPQQSDYLWGSIETYNWTNLMGEKLKGLLVKPANFDPSKRYPLIVNFYERSSESLYNHRAPYAHRSTINYTYYSNKGYVIFNPDVTYDVGHPGQSCYDDVVSGVKELIKEGFIDESRIGVQGHSWGGYQIAHLLTKTDIFKCAESGAPVVNMVSAYGGIRWGSGMSRMFQYERTQSRLGGTLWERPDLYIENSPIFNMDRVNTPVLILHNDEDGAVPWYQGIEYFTALRRLGKPSWLLNYNSEPHWPVKWQNRLDFNIRMEQFFDHYLMDAPIPVWMQNGVPAIEKGINQGLGY